jgi:colicin import membrane protein
VLQTDAEIQLKVWKDLAISKQVLMGAATRALGLDPECSTDDLRSALSTAIKRAEEADTNIVRIREQTTQELTEMKARVDSSEKAQAEAEETMAEATTARETAERQIAIAKSENAEAVRKAKADVADKQNKLTAISKALADTPDNVVKKLKILKKQKLDEAKIRTVIEAQLRTTRKEKTKIEQENEAQKAQLEKSALLVDSVREMRDLCEQANEKIKSLSEDEQDLIAIPKLDEELLESLAETPADS